MKALIVLNDPPYGTERCYNALRLAHALLKNDPAADHGLSHGRCRCRGAQRPEDAGRILQHGAHAKRVISSKGQVLLCGTCMDARGMTDDDVTDGARRSTMDELTASTIAADKVLIF